jgi:alpha-beta hydrolase superfamily lysophospholipase
MAVAERFFREWEIDHPRSVVALVHGIAEHSGRYGHVAERLNEAGHSAVAVDLRGHGHSSGWPGIVHALDDWLADVAALLDRARAGANGRPVFLLGHSLGALICATFVSRNHHSVDGLVLSGTAALVGPAYLEAAGRGEGVPPEAVSRDPDVVRAYREDPLVFYDCVSPEANALALEAAIEVNVSAEQIKLPVLMVHGGGDLVAEPEGASDVFASIGSADKRIEVYDGLFHEVLNEPERGRVLDDIVAWLDEHVPP